MKQANSMQVDFQLPGARIGIIAARFNPAIVEGLLAGALDVLQRCGVQRDDIHIFHVPGAFEMPLAAKRMALTRRYDALVALGAVIRGETAHFEYVAGACTNGLAEVSLQNNIAIGFGVLTVNNEQQALERAAPNHENKGREAALAALQMVKLLWDVESPAATESYMDASKSSPRSVK
ncbi:MAG TPA: 6,7-dimethyl-8-ribityllumazine synthase [Gammaproteobacteria bacterium]|nr:6,7-dimethyl-8-ribityllumazine synthase [Gammaproteobacteria bacterium]